MAPDSYNFCATRIVCATEKPILRDASCCKVEVVNGADGDFLAGLAMTDETENILSDACVRNTFASSTDEYITSALARKLPAGVEKRAWVWILGVGTKA